MKNREIEKNIGLTFEFVRNLIAHPEKVNEVPDQAEIEFIEEEYVEKQLEQADKRVFLRVKHTFEVIETTS